jgi:hypothetical protein
MADEKHERALSEKEARRVLARAANLDADASLVPVERLRASAIEAGIDPRAVDRALSETEPTVSSAGRRFLGLRVNPSASVELAGESLAAAVTIADQLRTVLGAEATITQEPGAIRAVAEGVTATVVTGQQPRAVVSWDRSTDVAVTAVAAVGGGAILGAFATLAAGIADQAPVVLGAVGSGIVSGVLVWHVGWRRALGRAQQRVRHIADALGQALSRTDRA